MSWYARFCLCLLLPAALAVGVAAENDVFLDEEARLVAAAPDLSCDCDRILNDVNVTMAIAIAERTYGAFDAKAWYESVMEYLDFFHTVLTHNVHLISANIDQGLSAFVGDDNATEAATMHPEQNTSAGMSDYFNRLFRDETYLYGEESSYLILRGGFETNKEEGVSFLNQVRLAIALPKTQNTLQIYVGDPLQTDEKVITDTGKIDRTTTVGARYFLPTALENLKVDLSAGFRGLPDPFTQLRVEYPVDFTEWLFRPVQYAEYSVQREFFEATHLNFDRRISKREMIRLRLERSTETKKVGMQYGASVSYFNTLAHKVGFRTYIGADGETKVNWDRYANPHYAIKPRAGIIRYSVGGSWKQSFLRRWLFYEIEPRVNFDLLYDWRPNYVVRYWLEFYFGDI